MATPHEQYKGPSKLMGGLGGWFAGSLISSIVTIPLNMRATVQGRIASGTAIAIGLGASIYGAIKGAGAAAKGRAQFEAKQAEVEAAQAQTQQLVQIVGIEREQSRKFTDMIASREPVPVRPAQHGDLAATVDSAPHTPHAPKTYHEHASEEQAAEAGPHHKTTHAAVHEPKGSHTDAVEASRAAAQETAMAI